MIESWASLKPEVSYETGRTRKRWEQPTGGPEGVECRQLLRCLGENNVCEQNNENEDMTPRDVVWRRCIVGMRESTGRGTWQSPE